MKQTVRRPLCWLLALVMLLSLLPTMALADGEAAHTHKGSDISFQEWTSENSLPDVAGSWYLTGDVTLSSTWTVPSGGVNLCLNGYGITMTGNGSTIYIPTGTTFSLYDCNEREAYHAFDIDVNGYAKNVREIEETALESENLFFSGGFITSTVSANAEKLAEAGAIRVDNDKNGNYATFNMHGGTVLGFQGSNGGAVRVYGRFNMSGGQICYNKARNTGAGGAGVRLLNEMTKGQMTMSGGLIHHNYAVEKGGGVWVDHGTLTVTGGEITNNTSGKDGAGIFVSTNGTLNISGSPIIRDNKKGSDDSNVYLDAGKKITITGALTDSAAIGIKTSATPTSSNPVAFTSGWKNMMLDADPSGFFTSDEGYTVSRSTDGKEAAINADGKYCLTWYTDVDLKKSGSKYLKADASLPDLTDPAVDDYTFVGWTTEKNDSGKQEYDYKAIANVEFFDPKTEKMPAANLTLYPVFVMHRIYVTLNPNAGNDDLGHMDHQILTFHLDINEKISVYPFDTDKETGEKTVYTDEGLLCATRPGYWLNGWYTKGGVLWNDETSKGGISWREATTEDRWWPMTKDYCDSTETKPEAEKHYRYYEATLTAQWQLADADISFVLGEGTVTEDEQAQLNDVVVKAGETVTIPNVTPKKLGCGFTGWQVKEGGNVYYPGNSLTYADLTDVATLCSANNTEHNEIVLTATYKELPETAYLIVYDTDSSITIDSEVVYLTSPDATSVEVTKPDATMETEGRDFQGWFTKDDKELFKNGKETDEVPVALAEEQTITISAKWKNREYEVSYYKISGDTEPYKVISYEYGKLIEPWPEDPARAYHTFVGWRGLKKGLLMPAQNFSVSAEWKPNTYKVVFQYGDQEETQEDVVFGAELSAPEVEDTEERIFVEWTDSNGKTVVPDYLDSDLVSPDLANGGTVTFTAKFAYAITVEGGAADRAYAAENEIVTITAEVPEGKVFVEWTGSDGVEFRDATDAVTSFEMPAKAVTVKAGFRGNGGETYTGESVATYQVILPEATEGGKLSASTRTAAKGAKVTITAKSDEGYQLDQLTVKDIDGAAIALTDNGDGTWSFTMPAGSVTVSASFVPEKAPIKFVDVPEDAWYYDDVFWAADNGIALGTDATHFSPEKECTRAQFMTFLWRAAGKPAPAGTANPFKDVKAGEYYYDAVLWAVGQGITNGVDEAHFAPEAPVTRAQAITFLYRYEQSIGKGFTGLWAFQLDYPDAEDVPEWAYEAFCWMVSEDICKGCDGQLLPNEKCRRCEVVALLARCFAE